eukprot:2475940-Pyramimonas_sp.AAC.2
MPPRPGRGCPRLRARADYLLRYTRLFSISPGALRIEDSVPVRLAKSIDELPPATSVLTLVNWCAMATTWAQASTAAKPKALPLTFKA